MVSLLGCYSVSYSQEAKKEDGKFTISAQLRTRGEYRNGVLFPRNQGDLPASFINNRARLSFGYDTKNLTIGISAQHVGVWGQTPLINKKGDFILNEAWAKLKFTPEFFVKLGRQTLAYDDERLLGGLDWNVAGRFHDALVLGYNEDGHQLHGIFAFNQNDEKVIGGTYYDNSQTKLYKAMQTIWYHYQSPETPVGISLILLNLGYEYGNSKKVDTKYMQTFGTHITYNPKKWNLSGTIYFQTGENATRSIFAYMGSLKAVYKATKLWSLNLGADYLSGNDSKDGKFKAFDPLFGTHHKFYGAMDYFYASAFSAGYAPGLCDLQLGTSYKVSPKVSMSLNYHNFSTAVKLDGLKKQLGSEIDYQIDIKLMKDVSISAGYSTMFGGKTMNVVKGGNCKSWQDWGWISINIKPTLFCR